MNNIDTSELTDKELEDFAVQVAVEYLGLRNIAAWQRARSTAA